MALLGSTVDPRLFIQDYSGFVDAAKMQAQGVMGLGQSIGQGIEKYQEAKKERQKLDASRKSAITNIESAVKMGESFGIPLGSTLQPVLDKLNDPNTTPYEAAMIGQSASDQIGNVLKLGMFQAELQSQSQRSQFAAAADRRKAELEAEAARRKAPEVQEFGVPGGQQARQWDAETQTWGPIQTGGARSTPDLFSMVKQFEGFNPNAYGDYKQTSIGYGTKGKPGETITEQEASERLRTELSGHAQRILDAASQKGIQLNTNQFNALTSFDFNTGKGPDLISRFGDKPQELAAKITEYTKAGGEELPGLVRRRRIEAALYSMPEEQPSVQGGQIGFTPDEPKEETTTMTAEEAKNAGYDVTGPGTYLVKTKNGKLTGITNIGPSSTVVTPEQQVSLNRAVELDKKQSELRDSGNEAAMSIPQLKEIYNLLQSGVETGFGAEVYLKAKRILGQDVSNEEAFQSLVGNEAMKIIALTKGAISDREMDYFKNELAPGLGKSVEGNQKIIEFQISRAQRDKKIARRISEMQRKGASPNDIQTEVENMIDAESLISSTSSGETPAGGNATIDQTMESIKKAQQTTGRILGNQ